MEDLGLLVFDKAEPAVEEDQVGKEAVQVPVEAEEEQLAKVPVVEVSHHVEQEPVNLPHHRLVRRREILTCIQTNRDFSLYTHMIAHKPSITLEKEHISQVKVEIFRVWLPTERTEFGGKDALVVDGPLRVGHDRVDVLRRRQPHLLPFLVDPSVLPENRNKHKSFNNRTSIKRAKPPTNTRRGPMFYAKPEVINSRKNRKEEDEEDFVYPSMGHWAREKGKVSWPRVNLLRPNIKKKLGPCY